MSARDSLRGLVLPLASALARLREQRWRGVRFLCYHSVLPPGQLASLASRTLVISTAGFLRHLELIRRARYEVVSMTRALELAQSPADGQYVCLTFDDGRLDNAAIAWPLLREAGYPAHFFVSSALLGTSIPYEGAQQDRYMDVSALRQIVSEGGSVGSHARRHIDLCTLDDAELARELAGSREELASMIGGPVTTLAYPYANYNRRVVAATRAAGYDHAFGISTGTVSALHNALTIPRNVIRSGADAAENDAILRGGMDFTRLYSAVKSRIRLAA